MTEQIKQSAPTAAPKKQITYPMEFVQALASYLVERPYKEVAGLLEGIEKAGKVSDVPVETS